MDFYKHDIPDWMDGTEGLDDGPYRAYHVICQLIYLAEGPIKLNEHGIAGRCKQSIRSFRANIKVLLDDGKLTLSDGRLSNSRAKKELQKVSENRLNARKGGQKTAEVRSSNSNSLELFDQAQAPLAKVSSLKEKTRLEETRIKKDAGADAPVDLKRQFWDRAKEILGETESARSLIGRLAKSFGEDWAKARAALETASTKLNPRSYVMGVVNNQNGARRTGDEYVII